MTTETVCSSVKAGRRYDIDGLRVLAVYGSLERTPFNARASRMVVLAEKP